MKKFKSTIVTAWNIIQQEVVLKRLLRAEYYTTVLELSKVFPPDVVLLTEPIISLLSTTGINIMISHDRQMARWVNHPIILRQEWMIINSSVQAMIRTSQESLHGTSSLCCQTLQSSYLERSNPLLRFGDAELHFGFIGFCGCEQKLSNKSL